MVLYRKCELYVCIKIWLKYSLTILYSMTMTYSNCSDQELNKLIELYHEAQVIYVRTKIEKVYTYMAEEGSNSICIVQYAYRIMQ